MEMETDTVRIQKKIKEIFLEIDKICEKHSLRYYAIGGTCLGAVRHGGFIPWDDDLDIAMPREDYEQFKNIATVELPSNLKLFDVNQGEHYVCYFMKIHDTNTTFIERGMLDYPDRCTGVYVDIMPLDGIPNDMQERKHYFTRLKWLARLDWHRKYNLNKKLNEGKFIGNILFWRVIYCFIKRYPANYFSEQYEAIQKKYTYKESNDLCYTWARNASEYIFPKSDFEDYILLPFEDTQMRCPVGYDNFLTVLFGDYMKLPPEEERVACHMTDVLDLEKPFTAYIK